MLRVALRNAGRAAKRVEGSCAGIAGAGYAGGRAAVSTASRLVGRTPSEASAAAVAALGVAMATSVAFASNQERSFIMVKPDGVNRALVGEILQRFERKGYKLVGAKVLVPSADLARGHYAEHDGKPFFPKLVNFLSSGAVVAMVFEGKGVIAYGRTMIGATAPLASAPGTIRGDYGIDVGRNIIHGSDSVESAQREIALWFQPEELADYKATLDTWIYE